MYEVGKNIEIGLKYPESLLFHLTINLQNVPSSLVFTEKLASVCFVAVKVTGELGQRYCTAWSWPLIGQWEYHEVLWLVERSMEWPDINTRPGQTAETDDNESLFVLRQKQLTSLMDVP